MSHPADVESTQSIPGNLRDLLLQLGFVGEIQSDEKPCLSNFTVVRSTTWTGAIYRWLRGENRVNMMMQLDTLFDRAKNALETYGRDATLRQLLVKYLRRARKGLRNLEQTYSSAPLIRIRLELLGTSLDMLLGSEPPDAAEHGIP
jgi:hypothetical protein